MTVTEGNSASSTAKRAIVEFPQYLLDHVFTHLELTDLYRCQRVCRAWRSAILYYPALKPILFHAAPQQLSPSTSSSLTKLRDEKFTIHPVFSAIEQDWSIVLSEAVFSRSKSRNPMILGDYSVRNDMATYPALSEVDICADFERLGTADGSIVDRRRNRNGVVGRKTFNIKVVREGGVTVGDVWENLLGLISQTKISSASDDTLRETFMKANYHTFTWGIKPVAPEEFTGSDPSANPTPIITIIPGPIPILTATTPSPPRIQPLPWIYKKTFFGGNYRGFYTEELRAEAEGRGNRLKSRIPAASHSYAQSHGEGDIIQAEDHIALTQEALTTLLIQKGDDTIKEHTVTTKPGSSGSASPSLSPPPSPTTKQPRKWARRTATRKYDGDYDCLSF